MEHKEDSKVTNDEMDLLMTTNNNYDDEKNHRKENQKEKTEDEKNSLNKQEDLESPISNEKEDSEDKKDESKEDSEDKKDKKPSKLLLFLGLIFVGIIIFFLVDHMLNSKSNISKNDTDVVENYNNVDKDNTDLKEDNQIKIDDENSKLNELDSENKLESKDNNLDDLDSKELINIDTKQENDLKSTKDEESIQNKEALKESNIDNSKQNEKKTIEYRYYKLKPNETLFSLSMWYYNKKSYIDQIKRLNNISDVNSISTKKSLKLMPYKNGQMSSYAPKYYKIKKGETLFSISMKFYNEKRMIEAIKKLNNISTKKVNEISTGTTLIMP